MTGQQQQKKSYKVARNFTDKNGRSWSAGQNYDETDQAKIDQAVNDGNVTEQAQRE